MTESERARERTAEKGSENKRDTNRERERNFLTTDAHGPGQNAPRENITQNNATVQSFSCLFSFLFNQESLKPFPLRLYTAARDYEKNAPKSFYT